MTRGSRFESLDALRGLAILGMAWSGMLPDNLPPWMFHAQLPPPNHYYDDTIFGLTWVDLVFPFFLFSMGAAIPIAVSSRLKKGDSTLQIVKTLLTRGLLLAAYAIFGEHLRPFEWSHHPTTSTWLVSLAGFVLLVLMFIRWPQKVPPRVGQAITVCAWVLAALLIGTHDYPDGTRGFANYRNDIILMVLANVAVSGGIVWLLTRGRPLIRIGIFVAVILVFLTSTVPGSIGKAIWDFTPIQFLHVDRWPNGRFFPILYHFEYHKYLLIVLPGTVCGDLVLRLLSSEDEGKDAWPAWRYICLAIGGLAIPTLACWGLTARQVMPTTIGLIALCTGLVIVSLKPVSRRESILARFIQLGTGLLVVGLLVEPVGGGVRKDSPTLSYFLLTAGLAFFVLAALQALMDGLKQAPRLRIVTMTGMNPILGYLAITNLVMGFSGITAYSERLSFGILPMYPWILALLDGGMKTLLVAVVAAIFTERQIFLRA